ncbi:MAG: hypothetical protein HOP30_16220 [Cyclobacteriaceae bacterium]|nr:hypothetical protein [Cyclobacteriaceae bacterium]
MKTKVTFLTFLAVAASICGVAQSTAELDDMYFTSKDRSTVNAARKLVLSSESARNVTTSETASVINPTDSYSGRNVNPEYVAGSKVNGSSPVVASYFSPNYMPMAVNQRIVNNCGTCSNSTYTNFNSSYFPYSNYGYYGMNPYSSYSMMNPYYGFGNGFYQPGLSFSIGNFYGNGFGSPFYNNYYGMGSYYGYGSFYNSFYNPYGYGYSSSVIVVDRPRPQSARNAEVNRYYTANGVRTSPSTGGRVATSPTEYYNKTWRNDTQIARGSDTWSNTRSYQQNNTNWNNQNSWGNNNSGFGGSGGNRTSFTTGGAGGRSGGGAAPSGGGGGGGSRRGRD